jgi:hypothetical protein
MEGGLTTPTSSHRNWTSKGGHVSIALGAEAGRRWAFRSLLARQGFTTEEQKIAPVVPPSYAPFGQSLRSQSGRQDSNLRPSAPKTLFYWFEGSIARTGVWAKKHCCHCCLPLQPHWPSVSQQRIKMLARWIGLSWLSDSKPES